jgi:xanthine dehydrogenase YagS FAD-binding subunit
MEHTAGFDDITVREFAASVPDITLVGQTPNDVNFRRAADVALRDARPQSQNGFKIELAKRCLTHALRTAAAG